MKWWKSQWPTHKWICESFSFLLLVSGVDCAYLCTLSLCNVHVCSLHCELKERDIWERNPTDIFKSNHQTTEKKNLKRYAKKRQKRGNIKRGISIKRSYIGCVSLQCIDNQDEVMFRSRTPCNYFLHYFIFSFYSAHIERDKFAML